MAKDMTVGSPGKTLFLFALPMVLGNLFQQLYNIVDSIVVGNFVSSDALAAVGASASITFLFIAIATGLSIGSSVVISQYFGAGKLGQMKTAIYTILFTALGLSVILTVVGLLSNNVILRFMNTPDNIFSDASVYLQIYFGGLLFLFLYNTLTAVFNAIGDSLSPLIFLVISSILNIGLDLHFVISYKMGVAGVAYATLISQAVSSVISFIWLMIRLNRMNIKEDFQFFNVKILGTISRVAIPSIIQQSIVSVGIILVQALINGYGSVVMAGYTAATKIDSIAIMPMVNVGSAVSTFTAQNLGARKTQRVGKGLRAGLMMSGSIAIIVSIVLILFSDVFVGLFVDTQSNPDVIAVGVEYLRVVGVSYIIMGSMNSFNGVLRGAGDMKVFLIATLSNLGSRVLFAYLMTPLLGAESVWWSLPTGWAVGLIISSLRYRSGKWKTKILV